MHGGLPSVASYWLSLRMFSDMGQVLQADETVWVLGDNAMTDDVVGILFQPSLVH